MKKERTRRNPIAEMFDTSPTAAEVEAALRRTVERGVSTLDDTFAVAAALQAYLKSLKHAPDGVVTRHADERDEIERRDVSIRRRVYELIHAGKPNTRSIVDALMPEFGTNKPKKDQSREELDARRLSRESLNKMVRALK